MVGATVVGGIVVAGAVGAGSVVGGATVVPDSIGVSAGWLVLDVVLTKTAPVAGVASRVNTRSPSTVSPNAATTARRPCRAGRARSSR